MILECTFVILVTWHFFSKKKSFNPIDDFVGPERYTSRRAQLPRTSFSAAGAAWVFGGFYHKFCRFVPYTFAETGPHRWYLRIYCMGFWFRAKSTRIFASPEKLDKNQNPIFFFIRAQHEEKENPNLNQTSMIFWGSKFKILVFLGGWYLYTIYMSGCFFYAFYVRKYNIRWSYRVMIEKRNGKWMKMERVAETSFLFVHTARKVKAQRWKQDQSPYRKK